MSWSVRTHAHTCARRRAFANDLVPKCFLLARLAWLRLLHSCCLNFGTCSIVIYDISTGFQVISRILRRLPLAVRLF